MSAIYKLSIQGIRSFDSNDRETIQFGKPLTLIVGSNGSGKTTIIECLKYATTGDLPPNSKGGAFVHDPKITGEKDVRAQVKLAFTSANSLNMIVTRNIQLLAKKTSATFKTLEGQLVIVNGNGDRNTLSTRSLELDTQVPLYLGVPKAILEYVIFCHQEDSLWPLSEPSNLKKKFDEIFQAMKFTKALDNLKGIKKDMSVDIKLLKQSVEHLKVDKDRSKVMSMNISRLTCKAEEYQRQVKEVENQLHDVTEQSDKLFKSNQDFQRVLSKLENLKNAKRSKEEQIERISNSITPINLNKDDLESLYSNFSSSLLEKEEELRSLERKTSASKEKAAKLQSTCNMLIRRQGELNAAQESHKRNKDVLENVRQELQNEYKLNMSTRVDDFSIAIQNLMKENERTLNKFTQERKKELESLNAHFSELNNSVIIQAERLDYNKMDKQKLSDEVEKLRLELEFPDYTEIDLEHERKDLENYSKKLKEWEVESIVATREREIKEKNDQIIILENELEQLQERISKANQQAELFARLSLSKKAIGEKQGDLDNLQRALQESIISKEWDLRCNQDLDLDFKNFYIKLQKSISGKNQEHHEIDKKYTESSLKLSNLEDELKRKEQSIFHTTKVLEESLPEDCSIDDYAELVSEAESSYRISLENLKMHQTTLEFNKKALEVADRESCCYLCSRAFESEQLKSKLLSTLRKKTDDKFETTLRKTVASEKDFLSSLRNLERDVLSLNDSKRRVQAIHGELTGVRNETNDIKGRLEMVDQKLGMLKEEKEHAEKDVRPLVEHIVRLKRELKDSGIELRTITDQLGIYKSTDGKIETVSELQNEHRSKNEQLRKLRKEVTLIQEDKEAKSKEHSNLLNVIKDRHLRISEIERYISMKKNIEADMENKKKQLSSLQISIDKLENDVHCGREKIDSLKKNIGLKSKEFEFQLDEKNRSLKKFHFDVDKFMAIEEQVRNFSTSIPIQYEKCMSELTSSKNELMHVTSSIETMNSQISELVQKLNDSKQEKRNLRENLDLIELKNCMVSIEKEINDLDVQNAEAERDKYQQESQRLRNVFERLSSENAGKLGEIKQLQNQIASLEDQLVTDYKDIEGKYQRKWVQLQTKTFVTDDIDTYSRALDNAIMRYHKLKMEDINRIIDELWKRTYSGTDVDTIQLRSDEVGSGVKVKSYNYRVVMFKQDAELDMRGRCSAGQKVLASIIIRLALSETFGVNCGVIALDEPTTNLDEENIESLAKSLHNIIRLRMHQKNFQLIVITHDEKFLNHMDAAQFTDHFFRVKRDDRQKSQIEWVDINKVTD